MSQPLNNKHLLISSIQNMHTAWDGFLKRVGQSEGL